MFRLNPELVRIPDVSFVRDSSTAHVPSLHPDRAVEVLSPSNTKAEMDRELRDYLESGTTLVWYMDPIDRSVRVYTSPDQMTLVEESGTLTGDLVLPGFRLLVSDWFRGAERLGM